MISEGISNPFELLSALHDDELAGDERARAIRIVRRSPVARTVLADLADADEALRDWSEGAGLDDLAHALRADRRGPSRLAPEPIPAARRVVLPPAPRVPSVPNDLGRWALAARSGSPAPGATTPTPPRPTPPCSPQPPERSAPSPSTSPPTQAPPTPPPPVAPSRRTLPGAPSSSRPRP